VDQPKAYQLETENRGSYLYAIVGGLKVTPEVGLAYWREIVDECDELGIAKILLEHNFVTMISMSDMLEVIRPVADLLKGRSFAFVDTRGHNDIPEAAKPILRSLNVKMQLFDSVERAEKWLLAN
jgi:hypothetical protein